jgi:hypothetical protein
VFPRMRSSSQKQLHKLLKINGRHDWIRTNDLFRVKEAL